MVSLSLENTRRAMTPGVPRPLFRSTAFNWYGNFIYDVDKAGRFLMGAGNQPAPPITLLLNWRPTGTP